MPVEIPNPVDPKISNAITAAKDAALILTKLFHINIVINSFFGFFFIRYND